MICFGNCKSVFLERKLGQIKTLYHHNRTWQYRIFFYYFQARVSKLEIDREVRHFISMLQVV